MVHSCLVSAARCISVSTSVPRIKAVRISDSSNTWQHIAAPRISRRFLLNRMEVEAALKKECVTPTKDGSFSVGPDGDNSAVQRSPKTGKVADEAELPEGTSVEGPVEEKTSVKDDKEESESLSNAGDGVLTKTMIDEEKKLEQEAEEDEEKEKKKREQMWKQLTEDTREEKYNRLQFLLSKSNMYTQYLMERMECQKQELRKKQDQHQKRYEKKMAAKQKENKEPETEPTNGVETKSDVKEAANSEVEVTTGRPKRGSNRVNNELSSSQESQESKGKRGRKRKQPEDSEVEDDKSSKKSKSEEQRSNDESPSDRLVVPSDTKAEVSAEDKTDDQSATKSAADEEELENEGGAEIEEDGTITKPLLLTGGELRRYQIEGFNWLKVLYENGVNGILADEMGLGKTVQCIALISHLAAMNISGPFLVCAPLSTLPNWKSEFARFTPRMPVVFYHGSKDERASLRRKISKTTEIRKGVRVQPVVITSYEMTMIDRRFLQNYHWRYLIVDEGHRIKNTNCRLIKELRLYQNTHRLLLTGTPLQNNLTELWSLLNFLLPEIFDDLGSFETWFDVEQINDHAREEIVREEQNKNILSMLHQILTPFMLRRVKTDVDLCIPPKKEILVYCSLTQTQEEFYKATVDKTIFNKIEIKNKKEEENMIMEGRPKRRSMKKVDYSLMMESQKDSSDPVNKQKEEEELENWVAAIAEYNKPNVKADKKRVSQVTIRLQNIMMQLRKCCNHPYLLEYPLDPNTGEYLVNNEVYRISGKMVVLDQMLGELKERGHKVLLFSQMTKMLDIIEDYCCLKNYQYCRLDGSCSLDNRREQIDSFNQDSDMFIFLLSTRAGGLGINLTAADTVILYDSDWNPQCDLQAQDRCHRIGQTRPVLVFRFVTANTIDQRIVERAAAKRKLEKMVIHKGKFKTGMRNFNTSLKVMNPEELMDLLKSKDHETEISGKPNNKMTPAELASLLDRSDLVHGFKENKERKERTRRGQAASKKVASSERKLFEVIDVDEGGKTLEMKDTQ